MARSSPEPRRDPRYPIKQDDPVWRQWLRESTAPHPAPPGRPPVDGRAGSTPQVSVRLPDELRARLERLARWRRTSMAAVVRRAVEHYLDEGIGGRAGHPRRGPWSPSPCDRGLPVLDLAEAYADGDAGAEAEEE